MKTRLLIILIISGISGQYATCQDKYITKNGFAKFFSTAPLEDIEAENNNVQSIIDFEEKNVVINIPIKSFDFKKSLMQEHFNENYLESDKFPRATFKGKFSSSEDIEVGKSGVHNVTVTGDLTIHGVTKPMSIKGTIEFDKKGVVAKTKFDIQVADFDIEIPKLLFRNIAEKVEVTIEINYLPLAL